MLWLQVTAFTEIGIMQRLRHLQGVCQLQDYGIDQNSIYLVMTRYRTSLRDWRLKQTRKPTDQLKLYLNIFSQVAEQVQVRIGRFCRPALT